MAPERLQRFEREGPPQEVLGLGDFPVVHLVDAPTPLGEPREDVERTGNLRHGRRLRENLSEAVEEMNVLQAGDVARRLLATLADENDERSERQRPGRREREPHLARVVLCLLVRLAGVDDDRQRLRVGHDRAGLADDERLVADVAVAAGAEVAGGRRLTRT